MNAAMLTVLEKFLVSEICISLMKLLALFVCFERSLVIIQKLQQINVELDTVV